jgi:hypothetical protein
MTSKQKEKLVKMSLTVILISLNELALFGAPDLYLLLHPTNPSFVFYIMNLNKGMSDLKVNIQGDQKVLAQNQKNASSVLSITFYSDIDKSWFWCYFKGPIISFKMTPKSALMDVGIKSYAWNTRSIFFGFVSKLFAHPVFWKFQAWSI